MSQYQELAELKIERFKWQYGGKYGYTVVERNEYGNVLRKEDYEEYWLARECRSRWWKERNKQKVTVIFLNHDQVS
jgi:hypothetical protein